MWSYYPHTNITGNWKSNWTDFVFLQKGNKVTGYYRYQDGIIQGSMNGNILKSTWSKFPTYQPPTDMGTNIFYFNTDTFEGNWGYGEYPSIPVQGKKDITFYNRNCNRYRVTNNTPDLAKIQFNGKEILFEQSSPYIYPSKCSPTIDIEFTAKSETFKKTIPVEPGYSYTFTIEEWLPTLKLNVKIDNPL